MRDQEILDAAKRLFYERGFNSVTVDQIGAAAGTSGPNIYRHFQGKDELLASLFDRALDRLFMLTGAPRESPDDELRALARGHAEFALTDRELLSIYAREERSLTDEARRRVRRRQRHYVERWTVALGACLPGRSSEEVEAMAYALIGMLISTAQWPRDVLAVSGLAELMIELVENATAPGRSG